MMKTQQKELRDFQYFYKLEDSRLFDKLLISAYPSMVKVRNEVWKTIASRFRKNRSGKKEVLGIVLCNLKEGLLNLQTVAVEYDSPGSMCINTDKCRKHYNRYDS